jgi:CRISPR-associated protein Cas2
MDARLYVVAYDIRDPKRWRQVFKAMHGYGEWLQLSVSSAGCRAAATSS